MFIVISAHGDFDSGPHGQRIMQLAMVELKRSLTLEEFASTTVVCGANKLDRIAGRVWKAIGGHTREVEPEWKAYPSRKIAMAERDKKVLNQRPGLCISFTHLRQHGWVAKGAKEKNIRVKEFDDVAQTIDA